VLNCLGVTNEVQSSIPSHMKHFLSLDAQIDSSLRVKRCTLVFIGQQKNSNSNKEMKEEELVSSNDIIIHECDNSDSEIKLA